MGNKDDKDRGKQRSDRDREKERDRDREKRKRHRRSRSRSRSRSQSPQVAAQGGGGDVISLSIEETNKLRAKLGLKPLEVDPPPSATSGGAGSGEKSAAKAEFVHAPAKSLTRERASATLKEKTASSRQRREMRERLSRMRGLGDADDDDLLPASAWIERSRALEQERKLAEQRAKELAALDAEFDVSRLVDADVAEASRSAYSGQDLAGLRVEHSTRRFKEGQTTVLVLKDRGILDDAAGGEDEGGDGAAPETLINVNMVDDERYEANVRNRAQVGSAWHAAGQQDADEASDDEEGVQGQSFNSSKAVAVLSKYDSVITGSEVRKRSFVLGGGQTEAKPAAATSNNRPVGAGAHSSAISVEQPELRLATDFLTAEELQFKRRKRKVAKSRVLKADDLLPLVDDLTSAGGGGGGTVEDGEITEPGSKPGLTDAEIIESTPSVADEALEDLQVLLEKARRAKQQAAAGLRVRPEFRVLEVVAAASEVPSANRAGDSEDEEGTSAIVLDTTAEFCRNIGSSSNAAQQQQQQSGAEAMAAEAADLPEEADYSIYDRKRQQQQRVGTWQEVNANQYGRRLAAAAAAAAGSSSGAGDTNMETSDSDDYTGGDGVGCSSGGGILEEEPELRKGGVAAALELARRKGYLEADRSDSASGASTSQFAGMRARNVVREDVRHDDIDAKFAKRDRLGLGGGGGGGVQEFKELKNYRPDVKLEYMDEMGRELGQKEAFDLLSHRFHGKGSGKKKTEKRLKKIQEEMLLKSMGSSDTPLGTAEKLHAKLERQGTAYVCLSGKGAAASLPSGVSK